MNPSLLNAVLLIDKQIGKTSNQTITDLKKILKIKKIGHSGTLDKFASGLLIICTGWATKLTRYFLESDKRYIGTIKLGIVTDTCDIEGKILKSKNISNLCIEKIDEIPKKFSGIISQMPPIYSALKIGGKRASDLAREGKNVELTERKIEIKKLDILKIDVDNLLVQIDVTCSKGTYIRSLARDIGDYLNTGAHLESLRRISCGNFNIKNAVTIEEIDQCFSSIHNIKKFFYKPKEALSNFNSIKICKNCINAVLNGVPFKKNDVIDLQNKNNNPFIIIDDYENLIAIADVDIDNWFVKYLNVFNQK